MKYLTPAEAAEQLGITPQAVTKLCRDGAFPGAIPPAREWQIPAAAVKQLQPRSVGRPKGNSNV